MDIKERKIKGVYEITLNPYFDTRGFFMRVFDDNIFSEKGLKKKWVQENHSFTEKKGIIRGLHFQFPPFSEAKLVRCINGEIFDVFVDLRSNSETFGKWDSIELSRMNKKMVFIPRGFAHGFCTLSEQAEVLYKVDNFYSPEHELGLLWNDPELKISWPEKDPVLSEKDKKNITLNQFIQKYRSIKI